MYVSIRRYRNVLSLSKLLSDIELDFVPRLKRMPGFIAYYALEGDRHSLTTITVFATPEMAEESNAAAAAWLREWSSDVLIEPIEVTSGQLAVMVPPIRG